MAKLDWRHQQILDRLESAAREYSVPLEQVISIKLRLLDSSTSSEQIYLGGNDYQLIEPALKRELGIDHRTRLAPRIGYERHESGPEIIGYAADIMGVVGGLYAFWEWLRAKLSSKSIDDAPSLQRASSLKVEIRHVDGRGAITETKVEVMSTNQSLSEKKIMKAIKTAIKDTMGC